MYIYTLFQVECFLTITSKVSVEGFFLRMEREEYFSFQIIQKELND